MNSVAAAVRNTVSISSFNRGQAGKIFEEVKNTGAKVVMKNNVAECVLLSPEQYLAMVDEMEDLKLALIAEERLNNFDPDKLIPAEEVYKNLGISDADLENLDDIELE